MADVTITAANVQLVSGTPVYGTAGEAITAGQAVYLDTSVSPNKYKLADANAAGKDGVAGIALNSPASGQPIAVAVHGCTVNMGGTLVVAGTYILSGTAGGVAPDADAVTGWKKTILGVALTAANLAVRLYASATAVP